MKVYTQKLYANETFSSKIYAIDLTGGGGQIYLNGVTILTNK